MTSPFRPPPKSLDGRTARELFAYERTVDNGEEPPPPAGVARVPDTDVAVFAGGWMLALKQQPSTAFRYFPRAREWVDASGRNYARMLADVHEVGAADARLVLRFTADPDADPDDADQWGDAGAFGSEIAVSLAATGPQKTDDWGPLHEDAGDDVRWQVFALGGDGALTPVVSNVHFQFRTDTLGPTERLFWRQLSPAASPAAFAGAELSGASDVAAQTAYTGLALLPPPPIRSGAFSAGWPAADCVPPLDVEAYTSPSVATVYSSVGLLTPTKSTSDAGVTGILPLCADEHKDANGPVKRFVGRPLAAQTVAAFAYEHWTSSFVVSGVTTGTIASRLWVWRPGVGRVLISESGGVGRFAQSTSGGAGQKYVLSTARVVRNSGRFPGFVALEGDRFILDVWSAVKTDCGFASKTQGSGAAVDYNGTTIPSDPEGLKAWAGTAAHTVFPRLRYTGDT